MSVRHVVLGLLAITPSAATAQPAAGLLIHDVTLIDGTASHRELELKVNGGIPAVAAIRIATLNAATFMGKDRDVGSVEEGKLADLVLLSADPLVDIRNAERIVVVIKGGAVVDRGALDLPVNQQLGG